MNWTMKGNPAEGDEISFCLESPTANKEASLVLAELTINRGDLSAVLRIGGDEHNVSSVKEMDDLLKARDLEELATEHRGVVDGILAMISWKVDELD